MSMEKPIGVTIAQIRQLQGRISQKLLRECPTISSIDVNEAQTNILFQLWIEDNVSITNLARHTSLANTTLTNMLDRLQRQGLITKVKNPNNKREYIISLTDKCRQIHEEYLFLERTMREINFADFSDDEVNNVKNYLVRMKNNLEKWENENKA